MKISRCDECGDASIGVSLSDIEGSGYSVGCNGCFQTSRVHDTKEEAIKEWNLQNSEQIPTFTGKQRFVFWLKYLCLVFTLGLLIALVLS